MRRLKLEFEVQGDFIESELSDLLRVGAEAGVVTPPDIMVRSPGMDFVVADVTVYVTGGYEEEVIRKGLESAIRDTDLVQRTLETRPGPDMEQKILDLFG
jgi:hypothetical protein